MAPVIRPAQASDLEPLAQALAPLSLFTAYGLEAGKLYARFAQALERGEGLWVAEHQGTAAGVCWFLRRGAFGTGAYLRTLAVAEPLQGSGVGSRLLAAYEAQSEEPPGGWFLLASDFNTGAHRFYQRHGYREVGLLPGFAAPGVTERIFWKPRPR